MSWQPFHLIELNKASTSTWHSTLSAVCRTIVLISSIYMSKVFSLQQNEDILFKHNATLKNGSAGVIYVTTLRFAWIPIDNGVPSFMAAWGEVESDKYKTGKSGFCAMRLQTKSGDPKEFYLGEATAAVKTEIENLRNAMKRATLSSRGSAAHIHTTSNTSSGGGIAMQGSTATTVHRRKELLLEADGELRKQYNDLVRGGIIDDDEFWESRSYLLDNDSVGAARRDKGTMSSLLADKAQTRTLNAEIIAEIFATRPIVKKVYDQQVPHELSEDEFWKKYFLSEMFTRRRSTDVRTDDVFTRAHAEEMTRSRLESRGKTRADSSTSSGTEDRGRKRPLVAQDVDLTSTYEDYHDREPLDPEDFRLHREMSSVLEKYARKSAAVMQGQLRNGEGADRAVTGMGGGTRRTLSEWGRDHLTELQEQRDDDVVPLHLKAGIVPVGDRGESASLTGVSMQVKLEITPDELLSTLSAAFPSSDRARRVLERDISELAAVQDKARRAAVHSAAGLASGVGPESREREGREVMEVPPGFEEVSVAWGMAVAVADNICLMWMDGSVHAAAVH